MKKIILTAIGIFSALATVVIVNVLQPNVSALSVSSTLRSCTDDSIIRCGTLSTDELLSKYDKNTTGDIRAVFDYYGIARSDIAGSTAEVKLGRVYNDGRVMVDGKTVATGAYSVARTRMASTARAVRIGSTTYYEGPNMGTFVDRPEGYEVYAMFKNGRFSRAVMAACGNPLVATPTQPESPAPVSAVPSKAPKPAPLPPVSAPRPQPAQPTARYSCDKLFVNKISRTEYGFSVDVTVENAKVVGYTYNYGDGTTETVGYQTVRHTYINPGTYTVSVTMNVLASGKNEAVTSPACQAPVTIEAQPVVPVATTIAPQPTITHIPKALPTTGPLDAFGSVLGFGSVTAAGYYWITSRRNLETAFVDKR